MELTRTTVHWSIFGACVFALLLSLIYASDVKDELAKLAEAPGIDSEPNETLRDDWMTDRLADSELGEISGLLRDRRYDEADERMQKLLLRYPMSDAASEVRRILTQMNLDAFNQKKLGGEILGYVVKSGDSPLAIASRNETSYLNLLALNGGEALKGLRPGDELRYRKLNDRLVIDLAAGRVELRRGDQFLAEFKVESVRLPDGAGGSQAKVSEIMGYQGRERRRSIDQGFPSSRKVIGFSGVNWVLTSESRGEASDDFEGVFVSQAAMQELISQIRRGNEVVIRAAN